MVLVSTYITTVKIGRESFDKRILLIVGIKDDCFTVSTCFDAIVILIFSDCGFCL